MHSKTGLNRPYFSADRSKADVLVMFDFCVVFVVPGQRAINRIEWFGNRGLAISALSGSVITSLWEVRAGCFLGLLCGFTYFFSLSSRQRRIAFIDCGSHWSLVSLVLGLRIDCSRICVDLVIVFRNSFSQLTENLPVQISCVLPCLKHKLSRFVF